MTVRGIPELQTRLSRLKPDPEFMRRLGLSAIREQKILVPRKTGTLGRSIHIGTVNATHVDTIAGASYAAYVELGTKPHEIVPRRAKALRFAVGAGRRLSGSPRSGAPVVFAKRVKHPGTKPHSFMVAGAKAALLAVGLRDTIIKLWNGH